MHKLTKIAAVVLASTTFSTLSFGADAFVTVNGTAISKTTANLFIDEQKAKGAPDSPELQKAVREELIRRELLVQEAKKAGIDKKADVVAQAEAARQALVIRAYVQDYLKKHPISDAQLKTEYEQVKAKLGSTEYKARHILVKTEDEAKTIIANLKKGGKFEELAKQSIDPGTKDNGGDLGWSSSSNFVKPFADALSSLGKGKMTEAPVKTDFGYHIIKLEDTRPLTAPSFEEVKPRLLQQAQQQMIAKMVEDLRGKAKIQ